jgi:hypothetical protein
MAEEREGDHEVKQKCHIERPPKVEPIHHVIVQDIRRVRLYGDFVDLLCAHIRPPAPIDMANALVSTTE